MAAQAKARWDAFAEKHPDRAAFIERTRAAIAGGILPAQPCDNGCGATGQPIYDWSTMRIAGWRCYDCRRGLRMGLSRDNETTDGDEAQQGPSEGPAPGHSPEGVSSSVPVPVPLSAPQPLRPGDEG